MIKLVVTEPFADFQKGDEITDPALVAQHRAEHPNHVVAVLAPDAPAKPDKA